MTTRQIYIMGWIYGILERRLGTDYDQSGAKVIQAMGNPVPGFATIHEAAMRKGVITPRLTEMLAEALSEINVDDFIENPKLSLVEQGSWQLGYYHGKDKQPLPPAQFDLGVERRKRKMTQAELAEAAGVDQALISRWERGVSAPNEENLEKLKEVLDWTEKSKKDV